MRRLARRLAAWSPARWSLAIGLPFGLAFAWFTPPLQPPDEIRHLARAFLIAEGCFGAELHEGRAQVSVPRTLLRMPARLGEGIQMHPERRQEPWRLERELRVALRPEVREWRPLPSLYSPLAYLPGALGVGAARALGASPVELLYLGRIANLLAYLVLLAAALRLAPAHRSAFLVLGLLPMSLFLAASLAADAPTLGIALLLVAAVLREAQPERGPLGWRPLVGLAALAAALGLAKPGYLPVVGLAFLVPRARFGGRARWLAAQGAWLACGVVPGVLWAAYVANLGHEPLVPGADPGAQLRWIAAHPAGFAGVLARTVRELGWLWATSFVGLLGHADTWLPMWLYRAALALLLAVALLDGGPASPVRGRGRALALGLAGAGLLATLGIAYLGWNEVAAPLVRGVQGRYLAPLAPLVLVALHVPRARPLPPLLHGLVVGCVALFLGVSVQRVLMRYWG
ncbi:MAG: DUF2142 domain-containing protein [Deltaproteobacteria bacterium]|nr:DUF2142 domain-containing protein [Deltaproteobacteria bacterium]